MAQTGNRLRVIADGLGLSTNSTLLDTLRLKNSDLDQLRDSFADLKATYNFEVQTYIEDRALENVGMLRNRLPILKQLVRS